MFGSYGPVMDELGPVERAVLTVLQEANGRVVSRRELARRAGLRDASPRRCDSVLVQLRRSLGDGAIRTVRSRGWALDPARTEHTGV
jgi:DNA-binding response OmpR family regulator